MNTIIKAVFWLTIKINTWPKIRIPYFLIVQIQGHIIYLNFNTSNNIYQFSFLLQNITSDIAFKKPANPVQFMIEEIEKLQEQDRRRKGVIVHKNDTI